MDLALLSKKAKQLDIIHGIWCANLHKMIVTIVWQKAGTGNRAGIVIFLYKLLKQMK